MIRFGFKRKAREADKSLQAELDYLRTRDSLTGQRNMAFAVKEFEKLKHNPDFGAVIVRIKPESVSDGDIADVSITLAAAAREEISRCERETFIIFCRDCEREADRLFDILNRIPFKNMSFAVGAEGFDENEDDFNVFFKRLSRAAAAAEIGGCRRAVR